MTESFLNRPEVRTWGTPILLVILGILAILFGTIPTWGKIGTLREDITAEQDRIVNLKEKNRKLLDFSDQSAEIDKQFTAFDQAITSESRVPELLTEIQKISSDCGVRVTTLQFSGESQKNGGRLQEVRLQYSSESSRSRFACLVSTLEKASRLVDLELLRYNVNTNEDTGVDTLSSQLTLLAYYTPAPTLSPDTPLTFSLSDAQFLKNAAALKGFKTY